MADGLKQWGSEVTDFLSEIGVSAETRVLRDLRSLAAKRHQYEGRTEKLRDSLIEIKTTHDGNEYRCIYFFHNQEIIIVKCFQKKTRKTPSQTIDIAIERMKKLKNSMELNNVDLTIRH